MPKVKICGLTTLEDAVVAVEAGVDLLGFIFYEKSSRYLEVTQARTIIAELHRRYPTDPQKPAYRTVGVFVNETPAYMADILAFTGLDWAQLSGDEPVSALKTLKNRAYKALRPRSYAEAITEGDIFASETPSCAPDILIDSYRPGDYGGTGHRADWDIAARVASEHRILLAGGLTPENVTEAMRVVRPWGVDVSSGVERAPGRKDHDKVRAFVRHARAALLTSTHTT
ncbi:MAG: N-(5'-phosphoribosyl)anthranilate isomerase [Clostridia bacterium]|nr:MAG: N-(5'-phosphoribosyl)anthranilate isomerase [Clostridia bacterium]